MSPELIKTIWTITAGILAFRILLFVAFSLGHYFLSRCQYFYSTKSNYAPHVSILVPCYNEEKTLKNCIESLLGQTYSSCDVVIINDGSTDSTQAVAEDLVQRFPNFITLLNKENGGKASALNYGLTYAQGDIVVTVDADSVLTKSALVHGIKLFEDPSVVAICGNIKVANQGTLFGIHQAIEYLTGLNIQRRTFALLSCVQVISGAMGAFRKEVLVAIGGYSSETLVEDMDVTIALARAGYRVEYADKAIAYTEVPETFSEFMKQRHRWVLGTFQILNKYSEMLFNPSYGTMGLIGLPYFLLSPLFNIIISFLFVFSVIVSVIYYPIFLISIFGVLFLVQTAILLYAIAIDDENLRILTGLFTYVVSYQLLLTFVTIKAIVAYIKKTKTSWNKLERLGKNILAYQS